MNKQTKTALLDTLGAIIIFAIPVALMLIF